MRRVGAMHKAVSPLINILNGFSDRAKIVLIITLRQKGHSGSDNARNLQALCRNRQTLESSGNLNNAAAWSIVDNRLTVPIEGIDISALEV